MLDLTAIPPEAAEAATPYAPNQLYGNIAWFYDGIAPLMSLGVWRCDPVRYVDWAHRVYGRAQGGLALACPIGTALLPAHIHGPHTDYRLVGVDTSWKMLRRARRRLRRAGVAGARLIRAAPTNLPFDSGTFDATASFNGLNGFPDRQAALSEMVRVTRAGGYIGGSSIVRGESEFADRGLQVLERRGYYPALRSRAYLVRELEDVLQPARIEYETRGAVVFFLAKLPGPR